ncbi:helix-turn-helix transcriptional regulator [Paenibacillus sp. strain BS8-2]
MRQHYIAPKPSFSHYICYPDMYGRYAGSSEHSEIRERGALKEYNLHLVFAGRGYVYLESGEVIELAAGDGFLYGRNAYQRYESSKEEPWDIRWIHFSATAPLPILREADEFGCWTFSFSASERFVALTERMYKMGKKLQLADEPAMSSRLYELLMLLSVQTESLEAPSQLGKRDVIRLAADGIRARCEEDWSLEEMAALTGFSPYHFLRMFKLATGRTPNQFLTESRMVRARLLLATTIMPVGEVARSCGFGQSSYFIKLFRMAEGLTPKSYRQLYDSFPQAAEESPDD